ncbi:MAG: class I tRNA ligase family protein, partial [Halalkalicoccus sp.]
NHLNERTPEVEAPAYRDADRWILTELESVAREVEADMEAYRFDAALRTIREFVWHDLADDYLELIKGRLYEGRPGERNAARHALYIALSASLRMLAPFSPFFTEEIYRELPGTEGSVHAADWPAVDADWDREEALADGELIAEVASSIRGWKSESGMALNADLDRVELYAEDDIEGLDTYDLSGAVNAPVYVEAGRPDVELVPVEVDPDRSVIGPEFRDRAGAVLGALAEADPGEIKTQRETGEIELDVGGETVTLAPEAVEIREQRRAESGEEVAVLETERATVLVFP